MYQLIIMFINTETSQSSGCSRMLSLWHKYNIVMLDSNNYRIGWYIYNRIRFKSLTPSHRDFSLNGKMSRELQIILFACCRHNSSPWESRMSHPLIFCRSVVLQPRNSWNQVASHHGLSLSRSDAKTIQLQKQTAQACVHLMRQV